MSLELTLASGCCYFLFIKNQRDVFGSNQLDFIIRIIDSVNNFAFQNCSKSHQIFLAFLIGSCCCSDQYQYCGLSYFGKMDALCCGIYLHFT